MDTGSTNQDNFVLLGDLNGLVISIDGDRNQESRAACSNKPAISPIMDALPGAKYDANSTGVQSNPVILAVKKQDTHESLSPVITLSRQMNFTPVCLKEASLDSPSFRASMNHLDSQVLNIQIWLTSLTESMSNIPRHIRELHFVLDSVIECLIPKFLQDGLVDQEYTISSLRTTSEGLRRLWGHSVSCLDVNPRVIANINVILTKNVKRYKNLRAKFDSCQQRYDQYVHAFNAAPHNREPGGLYEDACQLYQVRKEYLGVALDLVIELTTLGNLLDRLLVNLSSELWKKSETTFTPQDTEFFSELAVQIKGIQNWCNSYSITIDKLAIDMVAARKEVEDCTLRMFEPSVKLKNYNSALLNQKMLHDTNESGFEKHGYLQLKTWTKTLSRPVWVPRWAFIKSGIFGFLVLSPSKTFVQESNKFGILLCNFRYNATEERSFCFDIKTSTVQMTVQAETVDDLKSWFKVFSNEKKRILKYSDRDLTLLNVASNYYPPLLSELCSTIDTLVDRALSSTLIKLPSGEIVMSSNLSMHIAHNKSQFKKDWYFQLPLILPVLVTETTTTTILASSLVLPTSMPSALTANLWGSVNWGVYNMHTESQRSVLNVTVDSNSTDFQEKYLADGGIYYPPFYPGTLIQWDIQMRALFSTASDPREYCLLSFRGIWAPNAKQDLNSRVFVTYGHIYIYMQALGFASLYKGNLNKFVAVEYLYHHQYSLLKLYNVEGPLKMRLYVEDANMITKKLLCLIQNQASDLPKHMKAIFEEFAKLDLDASRATGSKHHDYKFSRNLYPTVIAKKLGKTADIFEAGDEFAAESIMRTTPNNAKNLKVDYSLEYPTFSFRTYPLPAKALFHVLYGDRSVILRDTLSLGHIEDVVHKPWTVIADGGLSRAFNVPVVYEKTPWEIRISQTVTDMVDDEYYNIVHLRSRYNVSHTLPFDFEYRFVIEKIDTRHCRLYAFHRVNFKYSRFLNVVVRRFAHDMAESQIGGLHQRLRVAVNEIGHHGKIIKAIYLYGKLSHATEFEEIKPLPPVRINILTIVKLWITRLLLQLIRNIFINIVTISRFMKQLFEIVTMHRLLIFGIFLSTILNIFLIGSSSFGYWTASLNDTQVDDFLYREPFMFQRLVYLKDIQELFSAQENKNAIYNSTDIETSFCFDSFKKSSFILNAKPGQNYSRISSLSNNDPFMKHLQDMYYDIGLRRHKLLVDLNILKTREKELARAEWRQWLLNEYHRCVFVESSFFDQTSVEPITKSVIEGWTKILEYCKDCRAQMERTDLSGLY